MIAPTQKAASKPVTLFRAPMVGHSAHFNFSSDCGNCNDLRRFVSITERVRAGVITPAVMPDLEVVGFRQNCADDRGRVRLAAILVRFSVDSATSAGFATVKYCTIAVIADIPLDQTARIEAAFYVFIG